MLPLTLVKNKHRTRRKTRSHRPLLQLPRSFTAVICKSHDDPRKVEQKDRDEITQDFACSFLDASLLQSAKAMTAPLGCVPLHCTFSGTIARKDDSVKSEAQTGFYCGQGIASGKCRAMAALSCK